MIHTIDGENKMNSIVPFNFEGANVRVIDRAGEPWFVAKDVADALGMYWNGSKTVGHVPDEWKGVGSDPTPGGKQEMLLLSEQGVYFFLGRSDKPKALPFQKWIAGKVLPSIRKTGRYEHPKLQEAYTVAKTQYPVAAEIMEANLHVAALLGVPPHFAQIESVKAAQRETGVDFRPLLTHAPAQTDIPAVDVMLEPKDLGVLLGVGTSGVQMNALLAKIEWQEKVNGAWTATASGKPHSQLHAWTADTKSGYNLKWAVAAVCTELKRLNLLPGASA